MPEVAKALNTFFGQEKSADVEIHLVPDTDLESVYTSPELTKIQLAKEGVSLDSGTSVEVFKVHSAILGSSSRVFEVMFEGEMKEGKLKVAQIEGFDLKIFRDFLRYLYGFTITGYGKEIE